MKVVRKVSELQDITSSLKRQKLSIGLVPTMGALHEGHMSLVQSSKRDNDITIVSIFVNPTQFNNPKDLETYPHTEKEDLKKLEEAGVDIAFVPTVNEVYPKEDKHQFDLGPVAEVMEGKMRPGHFNGVAMIVNRLFIWASPHRAYFGEKDFQQIAIIKRLVEIEKHDIEIVECPIIREPDGLAKSSRNVRLNKEERAVAPTIHKVLKQSKEWKETLSPAETISKVENMLNSYPSLQVEYYQIVNPVTFQPIESWDEIKEGGQNYAIGCIALFCGEVRLIDNIKYQE